MTDLVERMVDRLMGVSIPQMEGDNLAVTICSYFEDPDDTPDDDTGWTPAAIKAYKDLKAAISEHFSPLADRITALEAEIARKDEALRKCAEIVRRNNWRQNEKIDDIPQIVATALETPHEPA